MTVHSRQAGQPPEPGPAEAAEHIVRACLSAGFALAGVAPAEPSARAEFLKSWLAAGKHGTMAFMDRHLAVRLDVRKVLKGGRSVVMVADQYAPRGPTEPFDPSPGGVPHGRIARYTQGRDYHKVMRRRLHMLADSFRIRFPGSEYRSFVDTAPVMEREHAAAAGLGWIGKHTLLIHPERGSRLVLAGMVTTLDLRPPSAQRVFEDHCGTCTRCIDACPTAAISPYSVDASRCISYLTIERRGLIEAEMSRLMGEWVFGCDICQDVCPHNGLSPGRREEPSSAHPAYRSARTGLDLLAVLGWQEADREAGCGGTSLTRARLEMLRRNAAIAAANVCRAQPGGLRELRARLADLAADTAEPEMIRRAAAGE